MPATAASGRPAAAVGASARDPDRGRHRRGAVRRRPSRRAPDRQHDQADDRAGHARARHNLNQIFTAARLRPGARSTRRSGCVPGERMSVHDLLLALLLPSADDAAEDLAYNVGHGFGARGSSAMMNARGARARPHAHALHDADRPRHARQLLDRRRPRQAGRLRPPDRSRSSSATVALPRAVLQTGTHVRYVVNRNDLVGRVSVGSTASRPATRTTPATCSSASGTAARHDADQRRARAPRARPRATTNTLALLDYGFANFRIA